MKRTDGQLLKRDMKTEDTLKDKVYEGWKKAHQKLITFKKRNNSPLIVSRNGKIVSIPPEEL